jgi:hypothetical protein
MYKDRGEGRALSRESIDSKKRIDDSLEKISPSTSKASAKDKERMSMPSTSSARRTGSVDARDARANFEKTKFPDNGKATSSSYFVFYMLFIMYSRINCIIWCVAE